MTQFLTVVYGEGPAAVSETARDQCELVGRKCRRTAGDPLANVGARRWHRIRAQRDRPRRPCTSSTGIGQPDRRFNDNTVNCTVSNLMIVSTSAAHRSGARFKHLSSTHRTSAQTLSAIAPRR